MKAHETGDREDEGGGMFNLHLTDEQKAMRESVRNFVRKEIKPIANERDRAGRVR